MFLKTKREQGIMNEIDSNSMRLLQYNREIAPHISSICEPLFKNFGITHFWYDKLFEDGRFFDVGSDIKWKEYFHAHDLVNKTPNFFIDTMRHTAKNQTIFLLWPNDSYQKDPLLSAQMSFNICHGLNIMEKKEGFIESFGFATTSENSNISQFYINNLDILKHFLLFFKEKASEVIKTADSKKICILSEPAPTHVNNTENEKIGNFLQQTSLTKYTLRTANGQTCLTKKEVECLSLLAGGKTAKEIAKLLISKNGEQLSPRTVEFYINNIKKKTGFRKTTELVLAFAKSTNDLTLIPRL